MTDWNRMRELKCQLAKSNSQPTNSMCVMSLMTSISKPSIKTNNQTFKIRLTAVNTVPQYHIWFDTCLKIYTNKKMKLILKLVNNINKNQNHSFICCTICILNLKQCKGNTMAQQLLIRLLELETVRQLASYDSNDDAEQKTKFIRIETITNWVQE